LLFVWFRILTHAQPFIEVEQGKLHWHAAARLRHHAVAPPPRFPHSSRLEAAASAAVTSATAATAAAKNNATVSFNGTATATSTATANVSSTAASSSTPSHQRQHPAAASPAPPSPSPSAAAAKSRFSFIAQKWSSSPAPSLFVSPSPIAHRSTFLTEVAAVQTPVGVRPSMEHTPSFPELYTLSTPQSESHDGTRLHGSAMIDEVHSAAEAKTLVLAEATEEEIAAARFLLSSQPQHEQQQHEKHKEQEEQRRLVARAGADVARQTLSTRERAATPIKVRIIGRLSRAKHVFKTSIMPFFTSHF
jgi:hypothetical protein